MSVQMLIIYSQHWFNLTNIYIWYLFTSQTIFPFVSCEIMLSSGSYMLLHERDNIQKTVITVISHTLYYLLPNQYLNVSVFS